MLDGVAGPNSSAAPLVGRRVALRALSLNDYEYLRAVETSSAVIRSWRHRGSTPAPDAFASSLWMGVLAHFVVADRTSGDMPIGLYSAYNPDHISGTVFISALKFDMSRPSPQMIEGGILFLDYLFTTWPFRKLYVETFESNLSQFGSLSGDIFIEEGRLRGHTYLNERYEDLIDLAAYRESWYEARDFLTSYVRRGAIDPSWVSEA